MGRWKRGSSYPWRRPLPQWSGPFYRHRRCFWEMEHVSLSRIGVVGRGRLGSALATALREAGHQVSGPAGRGEVPEGDAIVLCVPDSEISAAAAAVAGAAPLIGHTSGATPLAALEPSGAAGRFGIHPLQTFSGSEHDAARFRGCRCAVRGTGAGARDAALGIA